jgi:hypothetical protein
MASEEDLINKNLKLTNYYTNLYKQSNHQKSLEIKTKSIENTLLPLVNQVS